MKSQPAGGGNFLPGRLYRVEPTDSPLERLPLRPIPRLLAPEQVTKLVRDQHDTRTSDLVLRLSRPDLPATHQAVATGALVSLIDADRNRGELPSGPAEPDLLPQLLH